MPTRNLSLITVTIVIYLLVTAGCDRLPNQPETSVSNQNLESATLELAYSGASLEPFEVKIDRRHDIQQGFLVDLAITTTADLSLISGFSLLLAFDSLPLRLISVEPGAGLSDNNWAVFDYEIVTPESEKADNGKAFLKISAQANLEGIIPDGRKNQADAITELAVMTFLVSSAPEYECWYLPFDFFWKDCFDNAFFGYNGDTLFTASTVYDNMRRDITNPETGWGGPPSDCDDLPPTLKVSPAIAFSSGGIDLECGYYNMLGDLNANGLKYEMADAVVFINYFLEDFAAFGKHIEASICASDVNGNGIALEVADLASLIRVINGDAIPYPASPLDAQIAVIQSNRTDRTEISYSSDYDIGAILLKFAVTDQVGSPVLGLAASRMEMRYSVEDGFLSILIFDFGTDRIAAGEDVLVTIPCRGEMSLIKTAAGDYYGRTLEVIQVEPPVPPVPPEPPRRDIRHLWSNDRLFPDR